MPRKKLLIVLLLFLFLMIIPLGQATTITSCTFDKDTYKQGQSGYITVTIYNDEEYKIRVTELTATINYYYYDGYDYTQRFSTNITLPVEIQQGNSRTLYIPFSLPSYIASGHTSLYVKAVSEGWNLESERWVGSEHPTYQPLLYIESPYKEQLDEKITINEQLAGQLEEQQIKNKNITNMMLILGATTVVFAIMTIFLFFINRRPRISMQRTVYS